MPAGVTVTTPPEAPSGPSAFRARFGGLSDAAQTAAVNAAVMCLADDKMDADVRTAAKKFLGELFRHTP